MSEFGSNRQERKVWSKQGDDFTNIFTSSNHRKERNV